MLQSCQIVRNSAPVLRLGAKPPPTLLSGGGVHPCSSPSRLHTVPKKSPVAQKVATTVKQNDNHESYSSSYSYRHYDASVQ